MDESILNRVLANVREHVRQAKGYEQGEWVNPLEPVDCVTAFMMAKTLAAADVFDYCVAVAPEGHVYGYFFALFDVPILSVHVDYSPRRCQSLDDLTVLRGQRVLVLEDDVVSGVTLRLTIKTLCEYSVRSIELFLGRRKEDQILENVPSQIRTVYLAEDLLEGGSRNSYDAQFCEFFRSA